MESYLSIWYGSNLIEKKWNSRIVLYAGVPHATTEDDVYKGYFIPKGSIVVPNVW